MLTLAGHTARRQQIAEAMALSPPNQRRNEIDVLAHKYNVSRATVFGACEEHKVRIPRAKR